jgi:hypothetical protein
MSIRSAPCRPRTSRLTPMRLGTRAHELEQFLRSACAAHAQRGRGRRIASSRRRRLPSTVPVDRRYPPLRQPAAIRAAECKPLRPKPPSADVANTFRRQPLFPELERAFWDRNGRAICRADRPRMMLGTGIGHHRPGCQLVAIEMVDAAVEIDGLLTCRRPRVW